MFIVEWVVNIWVSDPCPDAVRVNEYTGESIFYGCLVAHGHYEDKKMSKTFSNRESAESFVANGPKDMKFSILEAKQ